MAAHSVTPERLEAAQDAVPAGPVVVRAEGLSKRYARQAPRVHARIFQRFGGGGGVADEEDDEVEEEEEDEGGDALGWVVRGVDLELRAGGATAIAGPQNSGKTTLVETLAGLSPPTEGTVWAAGRVVPLLDNLPKLMQDGAAWRNVVLLARIMGQTRRWARSRIESVFELAGLQGSEGRQRRAMAVGDVQRLGIATMLHVDGVAYLVDSTLGGTEAGFRERCLALLAEKRSAGAAIVHTSRDLEGLERLCDSALWLERGAVVARGGIREVAGAVGADRSRRDAPELVPDADAARLLDFLRIAAGDLRAEDALHAATAAARDAGATEVGWVGLAAAAGYDVSEAERIVERLARRSAGQDQDDGRRVQ